MRIQNLNDEETLAKKQESYGGGYPVIGQLRKGAEKTGTGKNTRIGKDLDYFRFASKDASLVSLFHERYGQKPTELIVYFPEPHWESQFDGYWGSYDASGMTRRCNGQRIVLEKSQGKLVECDKACLAPDCQNRKECSLAGNFYLILPEIMPTRENPNRGRIGVVQLHTGSKIDIGTLSTQLEKIRGMVGGSLVGIPLILRRVASDVATPGYGRQEKHMLEIELHGDIYRILEARQQKNALARVSRLALTSGPDEESNLLPDWESESDEDLATKEEPEEGDFEEVPQSSPATNASVNPFLEDIDNPDPFGSGEAGGVEPPQEDTSPKHPEEILKLLQPIPEDFSQEATWEAFITMVRRVYPAKEFEDENTIKNLFAYLGYKTVSKSKAPEMVGRLRFTPLGATTWINQIPGVNGHYKHPNHAVRALKGLNFAGWPESPGLPSEHEELETTRQVLEEEWLIAIDLLMGRVINGETSSAKEGENNEQS